MKRRGFLGFLGGAAVSAPSMVKSAAASMTDMHLPGIATGMGSLGEEAAGQSVLTDAAYQAERFAKWNLAKLNPGWIKRKKQNLWVEGLDPDIAAYRSIALSSKIRMQRERNFTKWVAGQDNWFERVMSGDDSDNF